jgi:hypothetical protein
MRAVCLSGGREGIEISFQAKRRGSIRRDQQNQGIAPFRQADGGGLVQVKQPIPKYLLRDGKHISCGKDRIGFDENRALLQFASRIKNRFQQGT